MNVLWKELLLQRMQWNTLEKKNRKPRSIASLCIPSGAAVKLNCEVRYGRYMELKRKSIMWWDDYVQRQRWARTFRFTYYMLNWVICGHAENKWNIIITLWTVTKVDRKSFPKIFILLLKDFQFQPISMKGVGRVSSYSWEMHVLADKLLFDCWRQV